MARDELDLSDVGPSLIGRVVLIGSALAVIMVAAWLLAPILLAKYNSARATVATAPKTAAVQPQAPVAVASAAPTAPAPGNDVAPATTALASTSDNNAPAPAAAAAPPAPADNGLAPWPGAAPAAPPARPPAAPAEAAPAPPAPAASADTIQVASAAPAAPADTNADTAANADQPVVNVPLPRSRPSRLIAARLAIPLPRPRPDIVDSDAPTPAMRAFELQVERMR